MSYKNESDRCGGNNRPQEKPSDSDFTPATSNQTLQHLRELGSQFNRVEASVERDRIAIHIKTSSPSSS